MLKRLLIAEKIVRGLFLLILSASFLPFFSEEQYELLRSLSHIGHTSATISFIRNLLLPFAQRPQLREEIAVIACLWGTLELFEGIGLWKKKVWAEHLIILATGIFIPVEIKTLFGGFSLVKLGLTCFNILIVVWLLANRIKAKRNK